MVDQSNALLLCGTTVTTWSAYRLCKLAAEKQKKPIAIINIGKCRADDLLGFSSHSLRFEQSLIDIFEQLNIR